MSLHLPIVSLLCLLLLVGAAQPNEAAVVSRHGSGGMDLVSTGEPTASRLWGTVRRVLNATSFVMVTSEPKQVTVRLLGIEPPEPPRLSSSGQPVDGQPFGTEAATYLHDLLMNKQVQLDAYAKDPAGRTQAVVFLGDLNVNLVLVKEGLAWVGRNIPVMKVRVELEVAERQARVGRYGLWALPDPEPPWDYRKRHHLPAE